MGSSGKQAVIFLVDTNESMNTPYFHSSKATTARTPTTTTVSHSTTITNTAFQKSRLECAKEALETWISDLMIQSKLHEVAVIVLKSKDTKHHLNPHHFPNLLLLQDGLTRPTIALLRDISKLETAAVHAHSVITNDDSHNSHTQTKNEPLRGDVMDGLVLAADVMRRRTFGKKYAQRSIVILTDACHDVLIDEDQVLQVVDSLRDMDCQLHVMGMEFTESAIFQQKLPESQAAAATAATETQGDDDHETDHSDSSGEDENDSGSDDDDSTASSSSSFNNDKRNREKFLISVARLTGGSVRAVDSLQQVLSQKLGKRVVRSTRRKALLHIAPPGCSTSHPPIHIRVQLLLSKTNLPTLKQEAILLTEDDTPMVDGMGNFVTSELERSTGHFDATEQQVGVEETGRTRAVKYGDDYIPLNEFDLQGLQQEQSSNMSSSSSSSVSITILGYIDRATILSRPGHLIGPPYGITRDYNEKKDSRSSSLCPIRALAQAMHRLQQCAIGTYVKSANADPILVTLFPLQEGNNSDSTGATAVQPYLQYHRRLVMLQLPFAGDVLKLSTSSLDPYVVDVDDNNNDSSQQQNVCHDLIDAMMIPSSSNILDSSTIPNPAIRNFRKTLVHRAVHSDDAVVVIASSSIIMQHKETDEWLHSEERWNQSKPVMDRFYKEFFSSPSSS